MGEQINFSRAASIVGITVVGSLVASYIGLETVVITAGGADAACKGLDQVMPKLLPALYTFWMYAIKRIVLNRLLLMPGRIIGRL